MSNALVRAASVCTCDETVKLTVFDRPTRLLRHHHRLLARTDRRPLRLMRECALPTNRW